MHIRVLLRVQVNPAIQTLNNPLLIYNFTNIMGTLRVELRHSFTVRNMKYLPVFLQSRRRSTLNVFLLYLRNMHVYSGGIGKNVNKERIVCDRIAESTCNTQFHVFIYSRFVNCCAYIVFEYIKGNGLIGSLS